MISPCESQTQDTAPKGDRDLSDGLSVSVSGLAVVFSLFYLASTCHATYILYLITNAIYDIIKSYSIDFIVISI